MLDQGLGVSWILWGEGQVPPAPSVFLRMRETLVWPKQVSSGMAKCELVRAVCQFYLDEELKAVRQAHYMGNYPFDIGKYYESISSSVETIIRFSISAMVGECRHFLSRVPAKGVFISNPVMAEKHKKSFVAYSFLQAMLRRTKVYGIQSLHTSERSTVYSWAVPYNFWLPILQSCEKIFAGLWSGNVSVEPSKTGYGGPKWAKAATFAFKAARAWGEWDVKKMIIETDTLINQCHNNGIMLNKFDCSPYIVDKILEAKKVGDPLSLSYYGGNRGPLCGRDSFLGCYQRVWNRTCNSLGGLNE